MTATRQKSVLDSLRGYWLINAYRRGDRHIPVKTHNHSECCTLPHHQESDEIGEADPIVFYHNEGA